MTRLTAHFYLSEFDQPARHGFRREPVPLPLFASVSHLARQLEVIRNELGDWPIAIISGYRSPGYNRKIGGARRSQHCLGRAADFVVHGVPPGYVHDVCLCLHEQGAIHLGGIGRYPHFTHIDTRPGKRLARWTGSRSRS